MDKASVASTGMAATRPEVRMVVNHLLGKKGKVGNDVASRLMDSQCERIATLVGKLVDDPSKLDEIELVVAGAQVGTNKKRTLAQENEEPFFQEGKVHKLSEVPPAWLWAWMQKAVAPAPSERQIANLSSHGSAKLRSLRLFATGLPDQMEITPTLREKAALSHVLTQAYVSRGSIMDMGGGAGFFETHVSADGELASAGWGRFRLEPMKGDEGRVGSVVHMSGRVADLTKGPHTGLHLSMATVIERNYCDFQAYVMLLGQKHHLFQLMGWARPKPADILRDAELAATEMRMEHAKDQVLVDTSIAMAAKRTRRRPADLPGVAPTLGASVDAAPCAAAGPSGSA